MIRKEAIDLIAKQIGHEPIISANGFISRDLYETNEKSSNFYMIGSMGLASSIGLGIALKNPKRKIHVFDGDGNILMNLGSLVTIGAKKPKNFIHYIFDNNPYVDAYKDYIIGDIFHDHYRIYDENKKIINKLKKNIYLV